MLSLTAIEVDTKLLITWLVSGRDGETLSLRMGFSPKLYNIEHRRLCIVPKNDVELTGRPQ
jgi:hypothetical protein